MCYTVILIFTTLIPETCGRVETHHWVQKEGRGLNTRSARVILLHPQHQVSTLAALSQDTAEDHLHEEFMKLVP